MTRDEFKILAKALKAVYAQETFIPDQDAFNVWYSLLRDLDYKQATLAVQKYMVTEKFPPTIADIRTKASEIINHEEDSLTELAAWHLVRKAVSNSAYHSAEEFAKLPDICQRVVGSPATLYEWSQIDRDSLCTVEQSHFLRSYRAAVKSKKEESILPPSLMEHIRGKVKGINMANMDLIGEEDG